MTPKKALCDNDPVCVAGCSRLNVSCQENCPCSFEGPCSDGCPCDSDYCRSDVDMIIITPQDRLSILEFFKNSFVRFFLILQFFKNDF